MVSYLKCQRGQLLQQFQRFGTASKLNNNLTNETRDCQDHSRRGKTRGGSWILALTECMITLGWPASIVRVIIGDKEKACHIYLGGDHGRWESRVR